MGRSAARYELGCGHVSGRLGDLRVRERWWVGGLFFWHAAAAGVRHLAGFHGPASRLAFFTFGGRLVIWG